jgi:copper chaperone
VVKIEKSLKAIPGVAEARVHFGTGRIDVEHDAAEAPVETLVKAVKSVGYDSRPSAM